LDQGRLRGAHRRLEAESLELGNEPPLAVDGGTGGFIDRRRLSVQWFSGTILTGLCGAALMGGAVFASLDGQTNFASAPERIEIAVHGALAGLGERLNIHKTDRLPTQSEPNVTRQIVRITTNTRVHDRELVRTRPFARVSGNLSLTVSDLSANIPPFNPQKLLAEGVGNDNDAPAAAEPDAEVSFVTCDFVPAAPRSKATPAGCDLNSLLPKVKASTLLPLDEVMTRVRDVAEAASKNPSLFGAPQAANGSLKLSYAAEGESDPYLEARVVPENITLLAKTMNAASDGSEHTVVAKKGETVASILHDLGAAPEEVQEIAAVLGPPAREGGLKEGRKLRVLLGAAGLGHMRPLRVIVAGDAGIEAAAALSDVGTYVPVDIRNVDTDVADNQQDDSSDDDGDGVRLYQSLYETGLRNKVPVPVIEEMVRIYSYDVDFQRKVEPGDSFDLLYADDENGDGKDEVRYVSLTLGGETKRYYRYQTPDDGAYDFYDETGKSSKKFLVRKPVPVGIMTSPFGWRVHPLLHIKEFHSGVDWGAPQGTPIFAAGNGTIEEIGPKGGYGKYVLIRHTDGYETAYGHMTAFARGLNVGSHVRQGQVIGFVGSTGLATGAHVHFEILINNRFVNPMTVKLPRGRVLEGPTLAQFEKDRTQLDTLLTRGSTSRVAQAR
jgi:murein DD-endopeptidase MepM/ murein hydrolase activator NlpD